jgi:hypothetical protein
MPYLSTLQTTADRFRVTPRTVSRWRANGIDTSDAVQVAEYLMKLRHPAPAAMRAVYALLLAELLQPQSITH